MIDTLLNRIKEFAEIQPDKQAVIFKKEQLTYRELYGKIQGIAKILKDEGIVRGDRVCFSAVSKPEMVAVYLGIQMCGGIVVFIDKNGTPENIAAIYADADAKLLLTDKPMKEWGEKCRILSLREVYKKADEQECEWKMAFSQKEEDIAELLFTTGTTGKPKGVILTYKSVYNILMNTMEGLGIREDDRLLLPLPLNHSFGLRVLRAVLYKGATVVLQNGFTFAREVENNVSNHKCNCLMAVPASYEVLKSQMQDSFARVLGNMRFIEFGAGSLSIKQRKEITELLPGVTIYNTWGSSETGGVIFCNVTKVIADEKKIGSLGIPCPRAEIKVVDTEGNTINSDEAHPGRMVLKGDMQMAGYWKRPDLTKETLVDGWLLTGDMVYMDEDGCVHMLGRADDIINVGGEKVSPIEVEEAAGQYEFMRECACIGADDPDEVLGQIPVLFVCVKNGYSEDALIKFLSERMERCKLPRRFMVLEALPRNRMQKIDRKELRKIWENRDVMDLMNPVIQAILSRRSIRKFTDQEVPRPVLEMVLRAGYHAPSGHNMQSWKFTVLTKKEHIEKLKENAKVSAGKQKVHFYGFENPKALVLISNDKRNLDGCQDASCAAENIMLAAGSFGLGSCWLNPLMTLRNVEPVKSVLDEFEIPENHVVWAAIALGYPVADGAALKKKTDVVKFV